MSEIKVLVCRDTNGMCEFWNQTDLYCNLFPPPHKGCILRQFTHFRFLVYNNRESERAILPALPHNVHNAASQVFTFVFLLNPLPFLPSMLPFYFLCFPFTVLKDFFLFPPFFFFWQGRLIIIKANIYIYIYLLWEIK